MTLGLRAASYPVDDLTQAKRWYEPVLGIRPYFDQPFYVGFYVGGFELSLLPNGTPGISGPQPLWGVQNAAEELLRLIAFGATELEPVNDVGEGTKWRRSRIHLEIGWASSRTRTSRHQRFGESHRHNCGNHRFLTARSTAAPTRKVPAPTRTRVVV